VEKNIVLSKRMEAVVNMVSPQSLVVPKEIYAADIGCDHAYVSIALIKRHLAKKVIAMDVRTGPLKIAAKNIEEYKVQDAIELRLSDGMEKLAKGEVNTIIAAGMGGLLMCDILKKGFDRFHGDRAWDAGEHRTLEGTDWPVLILQPQSELCRVRELLLKYAYCIEQEKMLVDEGKYYTVIRAVPGKMPGTREKEYEKDNAYYNEVELQYGRYGLQHKDMVLYDFLQKEAAVLENIHQKLEETVKKADKEGREVPEKTLERLKAVKEEQERNRQAALYFT